jgi:two-component system response regulator RpaA
VIDDDAVLVSMMKRKLMLAGFDVEVAPDGVLAMQAAQRSKPKLVILDMQFPGGGGQEVMERLKRSASTRHVPVVILTASEDADLEARMIELGAAAYIQKPVELDNLLEEAHRLTRRGA